MFSHTQKYGILGTCSESCRIPKLYLQFVSLLRLCSLQLMLTVLVTNLKVARIFIQTSVASFQRSKNYLSVTILLYLCLVFFMMEIFPTILSPLIQIPSRVVLLFSVVIFVKFTSTDLSREHIGRLNFSLGTIIFSKVD